MGDDYDARLEHDDDNDDYEGDGNDAAADDIITVNAKKK